MEIQRTSRGIQAIEVGSQLLMALVQSRKPMSLSKLAREANMTPSKAHPYLASFGAVGLTVQDPVSGNYGLGPFAFQIGLVCLLQQNPIKLATPLAEELAARIEQTVAITVWGTHGPTVVYIAESSRPVHVNMRPGTVMSMLGTATGQIFSAYLPPKLVEHAIARELQDSAVLAQATAQDAFQKHEGLLADVRRRGLARVEGNPIPGVNAFSAPVFDDRQALALAITVIGSTGTFPPEWDGPVARELKNCTASVSYHLGYAGG
ncbi:IclR family transcriptional regulator [Noviherbaspirillum aerium]|uniref:IclR family transcriptional regulator n=1 Tax=Noviherbaspirillum aerium TaxID=2588497 RepID=UPI00124F33DF|nr:IclR family transcriptional regulator [Noviherbaspirillum aerium]